MLLYYQWSSKKKNSITIAAALINQTFGQAVVALIETIIITALSFNYGDNSTSSMSSDSCCFGSSKKIKPEETYQSRANSRCKNEEDDSQDETKPIPKQTTRCQWDKCSKSGVDTTLRYYCCLLFCKYIKINKSVLMNKPHYLNRRIDNVFLAINILLLFWGMIIHVTNKWNDEDLWT